MQSLPNRVLRASKAQVEAGREVSSARAWEGSLGPQSGGDVATRLCHEDQKNWLLTACWPSRSALESIKIRCSEILEFAPIVSYSL